MSLSKTYENELDTVHFYIDKRHCKYDSGIPVSSSITGAHYNIRKDNIFFNVSSKVFATPICLGAITRNNVEDIAKIFEKEFGIIINSSFLCQEVLLSRVDVKKDKIMKYNPSYYVSSLRSLFKRNTSKFDVYKHDELIYEHGLKLIPKTRKKCSYSVYNKGHELLKADNKLFRQGFDYEYLTELNNCLRSEVQFKNFETIKQGFHLKSYEKQTFASIFDKNIDVVGEQFSDLFGGGI